MVGFFKLVGAFLVLAIVVFFLGPRPDTSQNISFDPQSIGSNLDDYLANAKADHGASRQCRQGNRLGKSLFKDPKEYAIIYIHGFSASKG